MSMWNTGGPMRATVTDDKGNVIMEFYVTNATVTTNPHSPYSREVKLEGHQLVPAKQAVHAPGSMIGIDLGYGPDDSVEDPGPPPSVCSHDMATYQGLVESYKYCKLCGKKEDSQTQPRFANTYAQDSWRKR